MRTVFTMSDPSFTNNSKKMAYGSLAPKPYGPTDPQLHRIERGSPFQRAGNLVFATPQFKTQTIYSLTAKNAQLPSNSTAPGAIIHPSIGAKTTKVPF